MINDTNIKIDGVSKKYCLSLRQTMAYGIRDVLKNAAGLPSASQMLRKGEFWALDNVYFEVKKGETNGIIGANGSGKTTLLKLLNGIFMPDKGRIEIEGRVGALIELGAGFHPLLTGRENIYVNGAIYGMSKKEIDKQFDAIVNFAEIGDFIDAPVKHYSSGMYVRLGFAVAVHCEPDILLIDEVLAVGDENFQNKCFNKIGELRKKGVTTIFVSHNMHHISAITEHVVLLAKGTSRYFNNTPEAIREYSKTFNQKESTDIEKICSGDKEISFFDVEISKRKLSPGDSFPVIMNYTALEDLPDVEVFASIWKQGETRLYYRASNKAYGRKIDLQKGTHKLKIEINDIPVSGSFARIVIDIYTKNTEKKIFWWRIPVEFDTTPYSTGDNFLKTSFETIP